MAVRKKRRKARVIAYPPNMHSIRLNVTLHNQSQDAVYDYYAQLENFMLEHLPGDSEVAYEINEVQRKR